MVIPVRVPAAVLQYCYYNCQGMSIKEVQGYAQAALADGAVGEDLSFLAALGSNGAHIQNAERDLSVRLPRILNVPLKPWSQNTWRMDKRKSLPVPAITKTVLPHEFVAVMLTSPPLSLCCLERPVAGNDSGTQTETRGGMQIIHCAVFWTMSQRLAVRILFMATTPPWVRK